MPGLGDFLYFGESWWGQDLRLCMRCTDEACLFERMERVDSSVNLTLQKTNYEFMRSDRLLYILLLSILILPSMDMF